MRVLRLNVPLAAHLSTSPDLTLVALSSVLRLLTGFHVDPEIAQLEVLLIHFEVRVVLEAPIHLEVFSCRANKTRLVKRLSILVDYKIARDLINYGKKRSSLEMFFYERDSSVGDGASSEMRDEINRR